MPTAFSPQLLGRTEKALNAILARELAGTGLDEARWIALTLTMQAGGDLARPDLAGRLAGALRVGDAEAEAQVDALAATRLVHADGARVRATEAGRELHTRIRTDVSAITRRLWGDVPAGDLEAAGRVLSDILVRADAELAR